MVLTMLPVEPNLERAYPYILIPIAEDNNKDIVDENIFQTKQCDEFCGTPWRIITTTLGFVSLLILCIMIPIAHYSYTSFSNPSFPRFFVDSLRVSTFNVFEGELSVTCNVNLTISNNGINSTLINFFNFHALIVYKEDKVLALNAPIEIENVNQNGVFVMNKNENKTLHLTFNTTGWERDQPIVDENKTLHLTFNTTQIY
ncbi:hypothetical protein Lalb_Chr02g0154481 [Lupinus albus]|uniref:Uncharacterized protein n=1 Tax=Lupinus albus TaxID=3870 RepID=A0A6A4QXK2_LUPAL|nr:hypothetical protein Lalb_Chr02g0154481 [Lupinus albus]